MSSEQQLQQRPEYLEQDEADGNKKSFQLYPSKTNEWIRQPWPVPGIQDVTYRAAPSLLLAMDQGL